MTLKRVVVTGIGALTPIGNNVAEYWSNLLKGKSGAGHITYFNAEKFKTRFACELKGYNPLEHFTAKELTKLDRCAQYALVTTEEAIRDANVDLEKLNKSRVGVVYGTGIGGLTSTEEAVKQFVAQDGEPRFSPPPHTVSRSESRVPAAWRYSA